MWAVVMTATVLAWSVVMTVLGQVAAVATLIPSLSLLVRQVQSSGGREPALPVSSARLAAAVPAAVPAVPRARADRGVR